MASTAIVRPNSGETILSSWGVQVTDAHNGIQSGSQNVTLANVAGAATTITFPRPYASPPAVVAIVAAGSIGYFAYAVAATTTSVSIGAAHRDGSLSSVTLLLYWIAIGIPA